MSSSARLPVHAARLLALIIVLILALPPLIRAEDATKARILGARITAGAWLSSTDGYLQTPRGGGAGTTSMRRPTFSEIDLSGLDMLPSVDAELLVLEKHSFHYNYFSTDRSGRATLDKDLISQASFFPRGSNVVSDYDSYLMRLGYRARWLDLLGFFETKSWRLFPEIGYAVFDFHYKLNSAGVLPVDRKYDIELPFLGLLLEGSLYSGNEGQNEVSLESELVGMGWINGVSYIDADIRVVIAFAQLWNTKWSLVSGMRGVWMRRRDSQSPMKNDVNTRYGAFADNPWGGLHMGLRLDFP